MSKSNSVLNAGKYNKRIVIYSVVNSEDADGFPINKEEIVLNAYASVNTTKGFTLIANNSDFEKAYTRFVIRYPKTQITRDMLVRFNGKVYTIEFLNNVDEANVELELQCREVTK